LVVRYFQEKKPFTLSPFYFGTTKEVPVIISI